jgi:ribosome-associated protein
MERYNDTVQPNDQPEDTGADQYDRPSKSQIKRDMDALQALGARLVELGAERLAKVDMPDDLRDAVKEAQRISAHGGRRRQLQYIGRLMRNVDPAPIQAALDEFDGISAVAKARQHALERLRERFLEDESVLSEIASRTPGGIPSGHGTADFQQLRQLRRNALKERAEGKPPRAYRELFRVLRDLQTPKDEQVDD